MQFSLEKTLEKRNSSNPSYQSMDCYKKGIQFINSITKLFICLKMFIMQHRKKQLKRDKKNGQQKLISASATPYLYVLVHQLCVFDKTDSKSKWVEKLIVRLRCPNHLVYLWRYQSVTLCRCRICLMIYVNVTRHNSGN